MTTFAEACEAVYRQWKDPVLGIDAQMVAAQVFHLDGELGFKVPENAPWFRVSFRERGTASHTLGGPSQRRFTRPASVFVQVFVPATKDFDGVGPLRRRMQAAANVFEGRRIDPEGLRLFAADPRDLGVEGKNKVGLVEIPCDYEERK